MRPWSIILYERLFLASIVLGVLTSIAAWPMMRAGMDATAAQSGIPAGAVLGIRSAFLLLVTLIGLLLLYLTARRGIDIARIVTGAWFLINSVLGIYWLVLGLQPLRFQATGAIQILLQLVMLFLLFGTDDAKIWFKSRGGRR